MLPKIGEPASSSHIIAEKSAQEASLFVARVDSVKPEKNCGWIELPEIGFVQFHLGNGLHIAAGERKPVFIKGSGLESLPEEGDFIVFQRVRANKRNQSFVVPWGLEREHRSAQVEISRRISDKPKSATSVWE